MDRYQERIDDLMQNHVLETTEDTYLTDSPYLDPSFQQGGGMTTEELGGPNGGFPPIYQKTAEELRADKNKVTREYTKQSNVVPISEILEKKKNESPEPFIPLSGRSTESPGSESSWSFESA